MTFYTGESTWFNVLALIVVTAVIIHEIVTRRTGRRSSLSETEERPTDGQ